MRKRILAFMTTIFLAMSMAVPVMAESELPRLVDEADLLTDSEEEELLSRLDEISENQEVDVVILTVDSLEGYTPTEYADDFYDYNGYGFEESGDGILLLVSMDERKWAISTKGWGITVFTDAGQEYMTEQFKPYLSDGDYYQAFDTFATLCDKFCTQAYEGDPYDVDNMPKGSVSPIWILGAPAIGLFLAFIIGSIRKSQLKSVREQVTAKQYVKPGSMDITRNDDRFINRTRTSRIIQTESSSGGSSTHTSSSGSEHGGSSGSF